ncbi:MAG: TPM domain-containing protein, partial [Pseudomonadota bacterium]
MFRRALIAIIAVIIPIAAFAAFPKPAGFVNDFAGVMSAGSKSKVEGLLSSFEKSTGIEVAVATLPS